MELKSKRAEDFKAGDEILLSIRSGIMSLPIFTIQKIENNKVEIETPQGTVRFWFYDELMYLAPKGAENERN